MIKLICLDCEKNIFTESKKDIPKFCCFCGSMKIGNENEIVNTKGYEKKVERLSEICNELNQMYQQIRPLNEEYLSLFSFMRSLKTKKFITNDEFVKYRNSVNCIQFRSKLTDCRE